MNPKLAAVAALQDGVFTRRDAVRCGYSDAQIRARIRTGDWVRIRRGAYTVASVAADPAGSLTAQELARQTHRRLARAALGKLGGGVAASHYTAAILHGLPDHDVDLTTVHVTRGDTGRGRRTAGLVQHETKTPVAVVKLDGMRCVTAARAVVETATVAPFATGVVVADAALHAGKVTKQDLDTARRVLGRVSGATRAAAVIAFADATSESPGESRLRVLMDVMGLPAPVPQHEIDDADGEFVARVDFCFPTQRVVVEFDGMVKYRSNASAVVIQEKRREDRLRELGYEVVRVTWAELDEPEAVALRIVRALRRARGRRDRPRFP